MIFLKVVFILALLSLPSAESCCKFYVSPPSTVLVQLQNSFISPVTKTVVPKNYGSSHGLTANSQSQYFFFNYPQHANPTYDYNSPSNTQHSVDQNYNYYSHPAFLQNTYQMPGYLPQNNASVPFPAVQSSSIPSTNQNQPAYYVSSAYFNPNSKEIETTQNTQDSNIANRQENATSHEAPEIPATQGAPINHGQTSQFTVLPYYSSTSNGQVTYQQSASYQPHQIMAQQGYQSGYPSSTIGTLNNKQIGVTTISPIENQSNEQSDDLTTVIFPLVTNQRGSTTASFDNNETKVSSNSVQSTSKTNAVTNTHKALDTTIIFPATTMFPLNPEPSSTLQLNNIPQEQSSQSKGSLKNETIIINKPETKTKITEIPQNQKNNTSTMTTPDKASVGQETTTMTITRKDAQYRASAADQFSSAFHLSINPWLFLSIVVYYMSNHLRYPQ